MKHCPHCSAPVTDEASRCLRCGGETEGAHPVIVDARYEIEAEIGHGSMGVVYRARDVGLGRLVALKVIAPHFARNTSFVERFRREAMALASIRNDHVVQVYALGTHEGSCFYAMEFVEGRNLEDIVAEHLLHGTYVPLHRALTIVRQVAVGLGAVHARGIVHRDVKPANIVIEEGTGRPVLLDFGLARPLANASNRATGVAGSPPYMAPEQITPEGIPGTSGPQPISPFTDVYALACAAFELFTGRSPYEDENIYTVLHRHLTDRPPLVSSIRPELSGLDSAVVRALAKNPAERFASAVDFADALTAGASIAPPSVVASTPPTTRRDEVSIRVLIVDDDPTFCSFAARAAQLALPHFKVDVSIAGSGLRALTAAVQASPHLVVLDYDMPGLNGIETLSELRALPRAAHSQVLVVSGSVGAVERWRFGVLGVKNFLQKPASLRDLVEAIARLTRRARAGIAVTAPSLVHTSLSPDGSPDGSLAPGGEASDSLPREVFLVLLAVAWADGSIEPSERDAVLHAAHLAGLSSSDIEDLAQAASSRVELTHLDVTHLARRDRFYVYAMARWIAAVNGTVTESEDAMLRGLGSVLGLSDRGRNEMDEAVDEILAAPPSAQPDRFDLAGLRAAIRARVSMAEASEPRPVAL